MMRSSFLRASRLAPSSSPAVFRAPVSAVQCRSSSQHAVSNVTLADIEKRWESMPPSEQANLWMSLRDRMKGSWSDLTLQEKKASYWIAFGPHGPRAVPPPGEGKKVFFYTMIGMGISLAVFWVARVASRPPPKSMTREWQEATNEYLKEQKVEPLTGISSENYKGPGYIQSK